MQQQHVQQAAMVAPPTAAGADLRNHANTGRAASAQHGGRNDAANAAASDWTPGDWSSSCGAARRADNARPRASAAANHNARYS